MKLIEKGGSRMTLAQMAKRFKRHDLMFYILLKNQLRINNEGGETK